MAEKKNLVLLVQLGSPSSPRVGDVRAYLGAFLGDRRVVDRPPSWLWKIILYGLILVFRPKKSAALYARIWRNGEFPLVKITKSFAQKVNDYCKAKLEVRPCFLLPAPEFPHHLDDWDQSQDEYQKIILAPQFPQYSEATTASVWDSWSHALSQRVVIPPFEFCTSYHRLRSFIDLSAEKIDRTIEKARLKGEKEVDGILLSFHGIPLRRVLVKNDPYYTHCKETFNLIKKKVHTISCEKIFCTFQSRFGREVWLGPSTEDFVRSYFRQKKGVRLAVYAPSFVVDCLETVDELGRELASVARAEGGEILLVDCLGDDESWVAGYGDYLLAKSSGGDVEPLFYPPPSLPPSREELEREGAG